MNVHGAGAAEGGGAGRGGRTPDWMRGLRVSLLDRARCHELDRDPHSERRGSAHRRIGDFG
ncbi:hypothetical protein EYF80_063201 [Liparis tanakae]|uniref:Uncharacterized protein n=1 Tax=Liparis tanakae TaxID=230148 RepID=A0A4Z2EEF3_9TELE|nr:hypothetical protein EYF80_063201 [Liparis tanakae]